VSYTVTYYCPRCGTLASLEREGYLDDKSVTPYPLEGWTYVAPDESFDDADGVRFVCGDPRPGLTWETPPTPDDETETTPSDDETETTPSDDETETTERRRDRDDAERRRDRDDAERRRDRDDADRPRPRPCGDGRRRRAAGVW